MTELMWLKLLIFDFLVLGAYFIITSWFWD